MVQATPSLLLDEQEVSPNRLIRLRRKQMAVLRRRINHMNRLNQPLYFGHLIAKLKERLSVYYGPSPSAGEEAGQGEETADHVYTAIPAKPSGKRLGKPKPAPEPEAGEADHAVGDQEGTSQGIGGKRLQAPRKAAVRKQAGGKTATSKNGKAKPSSTVGKGKAKGVVKPKRESSRKHGEGRNIGPTAKAQEEGGGG